MGESVNFKPVEWKVIDEDLISFDSLKCDFFVRRVGLNEYEYSIYYHETNMEAWKGTEETQERAKFQCERDHRAQLFSVYKQFFDGPDCEMV